MKTKLFTEMLVTLENDNEKKETLKYNIRPNLSAQLWANSLFQSSRESNLKENNRFYNFVGHSSSDIEFLIHSLQSNISKLKVFHPEFVFPPIDPQDLQNSLNVLHREFADSILVRNSTNEQNRGYWEEFNILIHAIESVLSNKIVLEATSLMSSRIVFTWDNPFTIPIPDECYKDFDLNHFFGVAYANYSQVGRQFHEMYNAQDLNLPDEHIQPARYLSGSTVLWFGASYGSKGILALEKKIEKWFTENAERFNKLGFFWGDPRLALGQIPVASLKNPIYKLKEARDFQIHLSQYNRVAQVEVI